MVRKYEMQEEERKTRPIYWLAVLLIIMLWVIAFKIYFVSYENMHPDLTWAAPGMSRATEKIDGLYLWEETTLTAPRAGKVYYPSGKGPVRVAFGQVVAKIVTETAEKEIRAFQQGYFIAGTDGREGQWRYSLLWPELKKLPEIAPVKMHEDGDAVGENEPVGKLIPQPQTLRFIGLAPATDNFRTQIEKKRLSLMTDEEDTSLSAEISVSMQQGDKIKFLISLPWFNPAVLQARRGVLTIEKGSEDGAVIPMSALTERHGRKGVFLVRGTRVFFKEVEGHALKDGRYLVTQGVDIGDALVEDAGSAKEGRIQVW